MSLLFVEPFSPAFYWIYSICGISDILDGIAARKFHAASSFGQMLDSLADLLMATVVLSVVIPRFDFKLWAIVWMAAIVLVRFISLLAGFVRYHKAAFLHTYSNKITGLCLFFSVFLFPVFPLDAITAIICVIASVSAAEELLISLASRQLCRDTRSIFTNYRKIK